MSASEGYIEVEENIRLYFKKVGSTPEAVLIPNGLYFFDEFQCFTESRTLIFYDVRNRGFSDSVTDPSRLERGIQQDVDDLESVRRYFGLDKLDLIGHSYIGLMVALYAIKHQDHVNRVIQIGPSPPDSGKQYPANLTNTDGVVAEAFSKIAEMRKTKDPQEDPVTWCKKFWSILQAIYVADPKHATQFQLGRCELPNERNSMKYLNDHIFPSLQKIHLTAEELINVKTSFLIIHGTKDRSAPYGGGREWSLILPNARLLSLEKVAHIPWIEAPETTFTAIGEFLAGKWPEAAEKIKSLED